MRTIHLFTCFILTSLLSVVALPAQEPPKPPQPTRQQAAQLVTDGDRLADQGDYGAALEKYTEAYHEVVSRIRGQSFTYQVSPKLLTRDQLGQEMLRIMDREYTEADWQLMDASYHVLKLMPREMKSRELMSKLLTEEVAGFYDPETKEMVLIRENSATANPSFLQRLLGAKPAFDKQEQKTTLAHEMTHALQDQLYNLQKKQRSIEKDDDMMLAFSALVEGDATLLMMAEMDGGDGDLSGFDPETLRATFTMMSFMLPVAGGATYRQAPPIFRQSLTFPYLQGLVFAVSVAGKQGWPAVHAAYASPPTSTEQILHPNKYLLSPRDEPQLVNLPDLSDVIPAQWQHLGGNCLGEFQISVLLSKSRMARKASEGWDGDRYEVYRTAEGQLAMIMVSIWDSPTDAEEFAKSYRQVRGKDSGDAAPAGPGVADIAEDAADFENKADSGNETEAVAPPPQPAGSAAGLETVGAEWIEVHGDQVWIVAGFESALKKAIAERLSKTTFQPKSFPEQ